MAEDLAKGVDYYNTCCNPVNISCVGDTSIIKFSDLLCNDFTNGSQIEISSYTSSSSNISVTTNDTAFVVYSTIQDEYEIHYTVKGCDCRLLSSVFNINVTPCTDCSQIDPCINLVCTDGFEEFNSSPHNQEGLLIELVGGNYWVHDGSQENTPDLCQYSGNNYLHIIGYAGNPEGIAFKLSRAVVPGCTLKINLDASHGNSGDVELNIHGSKFPPCAFEDSRISNDCMPRDCGDFIFNPICIDTRSVENGAGGSQACPPPNLDSIPEIEWPNLSGDSINYIIISPKFPPTGSKRVFIDNVVITASCIESCFSYNYVDGCNEVQLNPCLEEAELLHQWDFGDGDTSMMVSPSHLYTSTDTFLVTHVVIDGCDNSDTSTLTIIVNGENTECCPDTTISVSTTWDLTTILPGDGRFHTITVVQGVSLTIEDGLLLEFCEGGALQIEDGATVDLQGTLTSYGEMTWKGVYVQGDTSKGQHLDLYGNGFNGLQQGMFNSREGSMIKNAKAGVRNYGMQGYARAGGMIRCEGTTFVNNTIAVEFGPYQNINSSGQPVPSLGSFRDCTFYTDSNYYHHEPFFGFARLFKADGMRFAGCDFKNNFLPELPTTVGDFGFGIHAVSAGFEVYAIGSESGNSLCEYPCVVNDSSRFAGLGHGIYVMTQDKVRPYNVYQTIFENCCRGLSSIRTSGGTILFNTFKLGDVPDTDFSYGQIGLELHFDHDGFTIEENRFIASDEGEAIPIGLLCEGLGEFDNEIRRNTFVGVVIANQAFGVNRDNNIFLPRGLRYFCNDFEETPSHGYDFYIPKTPQEDLIHPFQTPGSSQGSNVSTGNHFAYTAQDFMNYGEGDINYCYYPPGNNEEPRDSFLFNIEKDLGLVNDCASNYCAPPCIEVIEDLKEDYFTHLDDFGVSHDNFTNVVVSENQLQIDSARSRALYYRRLSSLDAYLVVQHLRLDTLEYNTDSLIRWMGYLDTYGAEVMIAGEYASIGDFVSALDVLETLTARRDLSLAQAVDLTQLLEIYYLLEVKPLPSFTPQDRLFLRNIAYSNTGAASGVSRALLSSFGEYIPLPYYNGEQINFRNAVSDSIDIIDTSLFLADLFPLKIYPNPSNSDITIEWKYPEKICSFLVVYDFFGQKVLELNGEFKAPFKLETDDWKDGVHWIIVQDNEGFSHFGKVLIFRN